MPIATTLIQAILLIKVLKKNVNRQTSQAEQWALSSKQPTTFRL